MGDGERGRGRRIRRRGLCLAAHAQMKRSVSWYWSLGRCRAVYPAHQWPAPYRATMRRVCSLVQSGLQRSIAQASLSHSCRTCGANFGSQNQLFRHINSSGHANESQVSESLFRRHHRALYVDYFLAQMSTVA